ncbi:leucine zipper protein 1 [Platysternon megacephalum]|uniref:Leucine zipper protein 1 n=1 Tax=Platysternon megacephalum TaxID=55544 RepID=A0A4D9DQB3_9SAUR|nr:leucine zipper protein 1 [Platysternon megacephalum]
MPSVRLDSTMDGETHRGQEESKDFVPSSRRKQYGSSEQLSQAETSEKRPTSQMELQQRPGTSSHSQLGCKTEDQVGQSKCYSKEN